MSTTQQQGTHSLAFRVMRLCKPSFHIETPFRLDPTDLFIGEDIFDDPLAASSLPPPSTSHVSKSTDSSDLTYGDRFILHHPSDAMGFSGLLVLPQSIGRFIWERHSAAVLASITALILKLGTLLLRQKFKRRGRGSFSWIHQNHLLSQYVQAGVMISLWNMMSRNLELIRWFALCCTMVMANENIFHSFSNLLLQTHYQLGRRSALSRKLPI